MISSRTALLIATRCERIAGCGNVDRAIVVMRPGAGCAQLGGIQRHADLGNGLVLYPLEAIGAFLLTSSRPSAFTPTGGQGHIMLPLCGAVVLARQACSARSGGAHHDKRWTSQRSGIASASFDGFAFG